MKNILFCLTLGLVVIFSSCDTSNERSGKELENVEDTNQTTVDSLSQHSKSLQSLLKIDQGLFRGIEIGTSAADVKKKEDTTVVEETKDRIDYAINYGELESADISYLLDPSAHVSGIEVFIYPKSKESQSDTFNEINTYYSNKYGNPATISPNILKWENSEKNILILMEKKDTQKVHDIKISFTTLTKQSASAE